MRLPTTGGDGLRRLMTWLLVIVVLLVGLDFGARILAEREIATQISDQGFPSKPSVSIAGSRS